MTLKEFVIRLNTVNEKSAINAVISEFINCHSNESRDDNVNNLVESLSENDFTAFGSKLGYCRNHCNLEQQREENRDDQDYQNKLGEAIELLAFISGVYQQIVSKKEACRAQSDEESTISHQRDVLREINAKIRSFKEDIEDAKQEIKNANNAFNDKIFSLLINTVAILGIFVTIAFAGYGIGTIFSNIDLKTALVSEEAFVKNIFYLLLTTFLCYNLILLLVYFIFKLSRPLLDSKENEQGKKTEGSFMNTIGLKPFLWVDGILGILVVAVCVLALIFW